MGCRGRLARVGNGAAVSFSCLLVLILVLEGIGGYRAQQAVSRAERLRKSGDVGGAIEVYRRALPAQRRDAVLRYNLARLLESQGSAHEALPEFRRAAELDRRDPDAPYHAGLILLESGRIDEAVGEYQEALRRKPEYLPAHYDLGQCFRKQGRRDEAIRAYERFLSLAAGKPEEKEWIARARQFVKELKQ